MSLAFEQFEMYQTPGRSECVAVRVGAMLSVCLCGVVVQAFWMNILREDS